MVLNEVHCDASHQGQQRTLALAQERFWWSMMAEDCCAIVRGCPHCRAMHRCRRGKMIILLTCLKRLTWRHRSHVAVCSSLNMEMAVTKSALCARIR